MSAILLFVLIALVLLAVFAGLAARRPRHAPNLEQAFVALRSLDIEAFRNLVSPEEEDFLRARLPAEAFRRVKRERARAALIYVKAVSHAALQFARFGDAAQRSAEPAVAASGREIANSAVYLRLRALDATARLTLALAFPDLPPRPLRSLLQQYDHARVLLLSHHGLQHAQSRVG
jgi:hypothetical protein